MFKRTKIVATVGPASRSQATLCALVKAGVDVFRVNFSHGDEEQRAAFIHNIRVAEGDVGRPVAICGDLYGPKIRVGMIEGGEVQLHSGHEIVIQRTPTAGSAERISTTLSELVDVVRTGETILLADGRLRFEVVGTAPPEEFSCRVLVGGPLSSGNGVNLPDTILPVSALTEKDRRDIRWIAAHDFDYVALSFVQKPADVDELRSLVQQAGSTARLLAKNRPHCPILSLTSEPAVARRTSLYYGVVPKIIEPPDGVPPLLQEINAAAKDGGLAAPGERIAVLTSHPVGIPGGTRALTVEDVS